MSLGLLSRTGYLKANSQKISNYCTGPEFLNPHFINFYMGNYSGAPRCQQESPKPFNLDFETNF